MAASAAHALAATVALSPRRLERPTSSVIATTPLEKLPQGPVAKAEHLLTLPEGSNVLEAWFKDPSLQIALYRQGTRMEDLRAMMESFRRGGSGPACAVEQRYARQLLAQVFWEAELCSQASAPASAANGPPAICDRQVEEQHVDNADEVTPCELATLDGPRQVVLASRTGPCSHGPPSVSSSTQVPPVPLPGSRPCSASEARWRESRERGLRIVEERIEERHQRWHEKERALAGVRQLRAQKLDEARERVRQRNHRVECQREALLSARKRQQEELNFFLEQAQQREQARFAKLRARERESADQQGSAAAARHAALESNRRRLLREEEALQRERTQRAEQAQAEAEFRRASALKARSAGPPALRAACELGRRQAARVARIREQECDDIRQRIQSGLKIKDFLPCRPLVPRQLTPSTTGRSASPAPGRHFRQSGGSVSSSCRGGTDEEQGLGEPDTEEWKPPPAEVPWPKVAAPLSAREQGLQPKAGWLAATLPLIRDDAPDELPELCPEEERGGTEPTCCRDRARLLKVPAGCHALAELATATPSELTEAAAEPAFSSSTLEEVPGTPEGLPEHYSQDLASAALAEQYTRNLEQGLFCTSTDDTSTEGMSTVDKASPKVSRVPPGAVLEMRSPLAATEIEASLTQATSSDVLAASASSGHSTADRPKSQEPQVPPEGQAGPPGGAGALPAEATPLQPSSVEEWLQAAPREELRACLEALMARQHQVPAAAAG